MHISECGRGRWRVVLIQLAVVAGLVAFYKLYLPHWERLEATRQAADRERKIEAFFRKVVVEDTAHEIGVPGEGAGAKRHPQRLRATLTLAEVEAALGAPDVASTDFRSDQHLTWIGTTHKMEGSFNVGRLYGLAREDRSTGHGVMVFESIWAWHPY